MLVSKVARQQYPLPPPTPFSTANLQWKNQHMVHSWWVFRFNLAAAAALNHPRYGWSSPTPPCRTPHRKFVDIVQRNDDDVMTLEVTFSLKLVGVSSPDGAADQKTFWCRDFRPIDLTGLPIGKVIQSFKSHSDNRQSHFCLKVMHLNALQYKASRVYKSILF